MSQKLVVRFQRKIDSCVESIEKFKEDLTSDPAHALSWSNSTFKVAATLNVLRQVNHDLESGTTVDDLKRGITNRIMHRSRYPAQSTSPTSNLIEQYELSALSEILSDLEFA